MSTDQLKQLSKIIRTGWKEIANEETQEYDNMTEVAKSILDELEKFEAAVEADIETK